MANVFKTPVAVFNQAVAAGATVVLPLENKFWGDRSGMLTDPFGYRWTVATRVKQVSEEELRQGAAEFMGGKR